MFAQTCKFLGPPLPLFRPVHIWLTTRPSLVRAEAGLALFETLQLVKNSHWRVKNLTILILDVHKCVFLLDNFDNSTPKDGVDHEVNVTHRHDIGMTWHDTQAWHYIQTYYQIIWVHFTTIVAIIFFPSGRPHLANHPIPLSAFAHFCLIPLPS